jgi:hypothetical protein
MRKGIKKIPVEKTALESRTPLDLAADGLFQDLSKWFIRYHLNLTVKGL